MPHACPYLVPVIGECGDGIFGISAERGSEKSSYAIYLVKKKLTIFNGQKKISAPLAPKFIMTD